MELSYVTKAYLESEGYNNLRIIEGRGICGIMPFIFTTAIVFNIDSVGYSGRWCYETAEEANKAFNEWSGIGDPSGEWIKYKGEGGERSRMKPDYITE